MRKLPSEPGSGADGNEASHVQHLTDYPTHGLLIGRHSLSEMEHQEDVTWS